MSDNRFCANQLIHIQLDPEALNAIFRTLQGYSEAFQAMGDTDYETIEVEDLVAVRRGLRHMKKQIREQSNPETE